MGNVEGNYPPDPDLVTLNPFWQRAAAVLWPSFLMAGVLEMLVFAFVDPADLRWLGGSELAIGSSAVYTLAFLLFWWIISLAGGVTQLLSQDPHLEVLHR
ncbi:hypothetical protein C7444_102217 [Sphaerotilus hippei]|uniref:Transmembrane protein n=1 Tax=Sphaerotilus hippei TaxID=744406 RepID=A0A318HCN4_9BURK|nr:hypothetical protein [Sphaerotilus hippei]PXW98735.1 hypothetical protein C7444_102217 [Sphaerotilus hippei]